MEDLRIKEQKRKEKESKKKKPNLWPRDGWSLSHLNLSFILYFWIIQTLLLVTVIAAVPSVDTYDNTAENVFVICLILLLLFTIWGIYLSIWNLSHKERSQWFLLLLLIPYPLQLLSFGRIASALWPIVELSFLFISNKSELSKESEDETTDEKIDIP